MDDAEPLLYASQPEAEDPVGDILSMIQDIRAYMSDPANMYRNGSTVEPPETGNREAGTARP